MSVVRAVALEVERWHPNRDMYRVSFKVLKRGRKKLRHVWVNAQDELAAFMLAQEYLRGRGYKV